MSNFSIDGKLKHGNYTYDFPSKNGTLALKSDLAHSGMDFDVTLLMSRTGTGETTANWTQYDFIVCSSYNKDDGSSGGKFTELYSYPVAALREICSIYGYCQFANHGVDNTSVEYQFFDNNGSNDMIKVVGEYYARRIRVWGLKYKYTP